jgi:hypothetical protein
LVYDHFARSSVWAADDDDDDDDDGPIRSPFTAPVEHPIRTTIVQWHPLLLSPNINDDCGSLVLSQHQNQRYHITNCDLFRRGGGMGLTTGDLRSKYTGTQVAGLYIQCVVVLLGPLPSGSVFLRTGPFSGSLVDLDLQVYPKSCVFCYCIERMRVLRWLKGSQNRNRGLLGGLRASVELSRSFSTFRH